MTTKDIEDARSIALRVYAWRLEDYSRSRSFRKILRHIQRGVAGSEYSDDWAEILCCIALVESHERRTWIRAAEWSCYFLSAGWAPITIGPFQMPNAPFRTSIAATRVIQDLKAAGVRSNLNDDNVMRLTAFWYGHTAAQPGSAFSYSRAIRVAENIIYKLL